MTSTTTADLEQLGEGHDLEAKLAAGRGGRGELMSSLLRQCGGTNKKKAGRLLDGRTWDQMPPEPGRAPRRRPAPPAEDSLQP